MNMNINYNSDSSPIRDAAHLSLTAHRARAYDSYRVLIITLKETAARLEGRLLAISRNHGVSPVGSTLPALCITDVGSLVNDAQLMFAIAQKAGQVQPASDSIKEFLSTLKLLRHSLQHVEDRIGEHFHQSGDSVFGDLFWRYRAEPGAKEEYFSLISGATLAQSKLRGWNASDKFAPNVTGVYDLYYEYVVKEDRRPSGKVEKVSVSIMELGRNINSFVYFIEQDILDAKNNFAIANPGVAISLIGIPPTITSIKEVD